MSQGDPHGGERPYPDEHDAQRRPAGKSGSTVNVPTVLASAGVAAVISALIVTIGVVGLATTDRLGNSSAAQPTIVDLGSGRGAPAPGGVATPRSSTSPGATVPPELERVPESPGIGAGTPQQPGTTAAGTAQPQPQSSTPAPLTAGQLNTKVGIVMNTNASDAVRAAELEGGQQALGSVNAVAQMLSVSGAGFSYKIVEPVAQNGTTLNARLQMSLIGNGSRYRDLSWVWAGDKWKLSNRSVCVIAEYAMLRCTV